MEHSAVETVRWRLTVIVPNLKHRSKKLVHQVSLSIRLRENYSKASRRKNELGTDSTDLDIFHFGKGSSPPSHARMLVTVVQELTTFSYSLHTIARHSIFANPCKSGKSKSRAYHED